MSIFKCKICGGSLEIDSTQSVATCEYCGTKQTLPKLNDERRANLYDRANHFRRNNDFDKAMGIYENILNEDNTDAEAYWSIVLCRYGIEYVEDPGTRKRVPTVNRAQFTSIFDDEDYKSAIANADGYQREIYEAEATAINEIQKGILAISQKEEPFDVFICYKETDTSGRRTQDSVLATELYHELTREGFKVFFSRITLEDKLGVAYEPYIFAALHSAKVMVVLGTRPEHFNAVWVKNEWSRYLALIKNGAKKTLIPAYRDMDPYDLPEEFSHLQAQDMSKLGFMQDLTRGIKKIVEADAPKATVKETIVASVASLNIVPLLKRVFMFLEDADFDRADEFCEQILNQDPENAQAYLGKLMAELHIKRQEDLANCAELFDNNKNYEKAMRFADTKLATELRICIETIKDRNTRKAEEARKSTEYLLALGDYRSNDAPRIQKALEIFNALNGYKDSDEYVRLCQAKIDQIRLKEENDRIERERLAEEKRIADEKARLEKQRQAEIDRVEAEKREKRNKKIAIITTPILGAILVVLIIVFSYVIPNSKYDTAINYLNDGEVENACIILKELGNFKDSQMLLQEQQNIAFEDAEILAQQGKYKEAYSKLKIVQCDDNVGKVVAYKKIADGDWKAGIELLGIQNFVIPEGTTVIASEKFKDCKTLTSVTIPEGVTKIQSYAFFCCENLQSISLPDSLIQIDQKAFMHCYDLQEVNLSDNVKVIEDNAFWGCSSLLKITFSENLQSIGESAFQYCKALKEVSFPNKLQRIGQHAFANCVSLEKVVISDSVIDVEYWAFAENPKLSYIKFGNSMNKIEIGTCEGCENLKTVVFGNKIEEIHVSAFEGCKSLANLTLPSSLTDISTEAFKNCASLTSVTIPNSVDSLGKNVFGGCTNLKSVTFENPYNWKVDYNYPDLSNPMRNVTYLTKTYADEYWYRK